MTEPTKEARDAAHAILLADGFTEDHHRFYNMRLKWALRLDAFVAQRVAEAEASDWRYKLSAFVTEILHGDEKHKQWLWDAAYAFAAGEPVPRPDATQSDNIEAYAAQRVATALEQHIRDQNSLKKSDEPRK